MTPGLKYGLFAAGGMTVWLFLMYALGLHTTRISWGHSLDWGTELILVVALWRLLRDRLYGANRYWLPVWEGLLHGLFASLIAAMAYYIILSLYLRFVNPEFPDFYLEWRVAEMRAASIPEVEIREMARAFRRNTGPVGLPLSLGSTFLLIGFVASPILALWLNWRRKELPLDG